MEFLDFREYQPGDDIRHLDAHLFARTGTHYVRQYAVYQQLPITIVVDGSASMAFGAKFDFARKLASALAFVGLTGGDAVQVAVSVGSRMRWSPVMRGARRAPAVFDWLRGQQAARSGFGAALAEALPRLKHRGLLMLISDWWLDNLDAELKVLGALPQEIVAVHVLAPEELDPARLGAGETRFVDSESGHEVELLIDDRALAEYRVALAAQQERVRARVQQRLGRYLMVRTDMSLDRLLLRDWRRLGLIA